MARESGRVRTQKHPQNSFRWQKQNRLMVHSLIACALIAVCVAAYVTAYGLGTARGRQMPALVTAKHESVRREDREQVGAGRTDVKEAEAKKKILLVNPWHPVPKNYTFEAHTLANGLKVDKDCYPQLQEMIDDCRAAGFNPLICSAYRSEEKQQQLFDADVRKYEQQGYSEAAAKKETARSVAVSGTSEHQTGLALDIVDADNPRLTDKQATLPVQKWLMKNCWHYGFILRYPEDKTQITGIIYEPWHYRYVGTKAAREISEHSICLEEYLRR